MATPTASRERMSVVIVGHVDHGKSTVIGRLLADTGSLPEGKLEQVRERCAKSARPFEYAFLLDALKDEQAQGITIDTARCFFKTAKRDYILSDAPGHIEFLKNMLTGAARAEAALLVIDAKEGIRENTLRHGYLLSMLGIRQIVVLVNKMDLVGYDLQVLERLKGEYDAFLAPLGVVPKAYIPVCAREGENLARRAPWFDGPTVLEWLDSFQKDPGREGEPLRLPVQDIYKFTENGDDRRIFAGTLESGTLKPGDGVRFHPSGKESRVATLEAFNRPRPEQVAAGEAAGVTLTDELYIKPGEMMVRADERAPRTGSRFRVNLFWLGRAPLIPGKRCRMKIGSARVPATLAEVRYVLDASDLHQITQKGQVDRHDVAEVVLETSRPVAYDLHGEIDVTGRFVLIDQYEIAAAGVILEGFSGEPETLKEHVRNREDRWEAGAVTSREREERSGHRSKFIVVTGQEVGPCRATAHALEACLFAEGRQVYGLGVSNLDRGLDADVWDPFDRREERVRRLGELARLMTDAGLIFVTALPDAEAADLSALRRLNEPHDVLVLGVGGAEGKSEGIDLLLPGDLAVDAAVERVMDHLRREAILPDYSI